MNKFLVIFLISAFIQSNAAPVNGSDNILNDLRDADYLTLTYNILNLTSKVNIPNTSSKSGTYDMFLQELANSYNKLSSSDQKVFRSWLNDVLAQSQVAKQKTEQLLSNASPEVRSAWQMLQQKFTTLDTDQIEKYFESLNSNVRSEISVLALKVYGNNMGDFIKELANSLKRLSKMSKFLVTFLISLLLQSNAAPVGRNDNILNDLLNIDSALVTASFGNLLSKLDQQGYDLLTQESPNSDDPTYDEALRELADFYAQLSPINQQAVRTWVNNLLTETQIVNQKTIQVLNDFPPQVRSAWQQFHQNLASLEISQFYAYFYSLNHDLQIQLGEIFEKIYGSSVDNIGRR